jgi:hypothetical protein
LDCWVLNFCRELDHKSCHILPHTWSARADREALGKYEKISRAGNVALGSAAVVSTHLCSIVTVQLRDPIIACLVIEYSIMGEARHDARESDTLGAYVKLIREVVKTQA